VILVGQDQAERLYSSRDVQDAAGLTARQQNDWDGRGALPHDREGEEGWRRFTPREVFVLAVCAEIRRRFGTPVERLRSIQSFMLEDGANHFEAAVRLFGTLGVGIWLLTDFEDTFIMDSELEFQDLWSLGMFGAENESAFVLINVTPLMHRVLGCLKEPIKLEAHGRGYEIMRNVEAIGRVRTEDEARVLEKVRSGDFVKVEIEMPNGEIKTIRTTSRPDPASNLEALLDAEPYQTITLTKQDDTIVRVVQEITTKPSKEGR
jgi:hypothetical protein